MLSISHSKNYESECADNANNIYVGNIRDYVMSYCILTIYRKGSLPSECGAHCSRPPPKNESQFSTQSTE